MNLSETLSDLNGMVSQGQIPQAVAKFFHAEAVTLEVGGTITNNRDEAVAKLTEFASSIVKVHEITLLNQAIDDNVSLSEYRFHFDMKDGSEINWHEVIVREWEDGLIKKETYFQN